MKISFKEKVYEIVSKIPKGKVMTYAQVAKLAGKPKAYRAIGLLMSKNVDTKKVPCHRVVSSSGALSGYAFGGATAKMKILMAEGVSFEGQKVNLKESKFL